MKIEINIRYKRNISVLKLPIRYAGYRKRRR